VKHEIQRKNEIKRLGLCNAECEEARDPEEQISTQQKQRMLRD